MYGLFKKLSKISIVHLMRYAIFCITLFVCSKSFSQNIDEYGQFSKEELFGKIFSGEDVKKIKMHPDNIAFVTLYINNQYFDEVEAKFEGDTVQNQTVISIYSEQLEKLLRDSLQSEYYKNLVIQDDKYLISSLNNIGIKTEFIYSNMRLLLQYPANLKRHREIDLWREGNWFFDEAPLKPAANSGFINFFLETKILEPNDRVNEFYEVTDNSPDYAFPIDKFSGLVQYIFNYHNWVLDGYSIVNWRDENAHRVSRGKTKLTKPLAENAKFITLGDLEYSVSGFLDYVPMLGLSYYTDFYSQPYFQTQYLGQEQIFLQNPSEVEIYINDRRSKRLNLDSGSYDLKEFALNEGVNDVQLRITDQTGYTEVRNFNIITYQENLKQGLHEFSYNLGLEAELGSPNSYGDNPRAIFFHRYGLTNAFTVGGSGNLNDRTQLLGVSGTYGGGFGLLNYEVALWRAKHYDGYGYNVAHIGQYVCNTKYDYLSSFILQARKFGENFKRVNHYPSKFNQDTRKDIDWDFNVLSDLRVFEKSTLALAFRTIKYHQDSDIKQDATATFFQHFGPVGFRLTGKYNFAEEDFTISASLSRRFNRSNYSTHFDSEAKKYELEYTRYPLSRTHSVALSADAEYYEDCPNSLYYDAMYSTYRAKFDIFGKYIHDTDNNRDTHEIGARVATAIAYADGKFAITRPISRSFAIISYKNDNAFKNIKLGFNPVTEGEKLSYESEINKFGHAVLPDLSNYLYRDIKIDTATLPVGYKLDKSNYVVLPAFYSGISIELNNTVQIIGVGRLKFENGDRMGLVTGYMIQKDDPGLIGSGSIGYKNAQKRILFFSDRSGVVQFDQLDSGTYKLKVEFENKIYIAEISVPQGVESGIYKLGDIVMYEVAE